MPQIIIANSEEEIRGCFTVMAELRPHVRESEFLERVRRQQAQKSYRLAYLAEADEVKSAAGFCIFECLAWGKVLYVDDLVTLETARSQGYGQQLFRWLVQQAKDASCDELHLDSGVQRFGAHRFYLAGGMDLIAHHFAIKME